MSRLANTKLAAMVKYNDPVCDPKNFEKWTFWQDCNYTPEQFKYPGFKPQSHVEDGMVIERDVTCTLRDGVKMYIDIWRPEETQTEGQKVPVILCWTPYGKHHPTPVFQFSYDTGVDGSNLSKHHCYEAPDPAVWCPRRYAIMVVDPRGCWNSEGNSSWNSPVEGADEYDVIEWAAKLPWSTGDVGLCGVSYLVQSAWVVAQMRPPSLKAMVAWEGWSEAYRDGIYFAGGIPETSFCKYWIGKIQTGRHKTEDIIRLQKEHPLLDEYWKVREVDLEAIEVPTFVVADWGCDLHTRGTIEAYKRISSEHKWLEVHGRKKWGYFYEGHAVRRQLAFMDRFLHGKTDNEVKSWPKVRVEVRERYYYGTFIDEDEWPIARTRYEKLYLDIPNGRLVKDSPNALGEARYKSTDKNDRVVFRYTFEKDVALVGHAKLHLSMALPEHNDGDVFAGIRKIDRLGNAVNFVFFTVHECGPLTIGCQRISHRELVPNKSTEYQPFLRHARLEILGSESVAVAAGESSLGSMKSKGKFCELNIELLPFTGRIRHGESIELVVQGADIVQMEPALERLSG